MSDKHESTFGSALIEEMSSSLAGVVGEVEAEIRGEWSTIQRRTYENAAQSGTGVSPFVEVDDIYWRGTIECPVPLAGIAFLQTNSEIYWAKSGRPVQNPLVEISLHARAGYVERRATLATSLSGSFLPGVPVAFDGDLDASCAIGASHLVTGRAHRVAKVDYATFVVILLQKDVVKMGRKHLWHLRDELALALPEDTRRVLTRGRTGVIRLP